MAANLESLVSRLEAVTTRLESVATQDGGSSADLGVLVERYDKILNDKLAAIVKLSGDIGGDVKTQIDLVQKAFESQREFLTISSKSKKPSEDVFNQMLKPTSEGIAKVQAFRDSNRGSKYFNNLSAISEAIPVLGWVTVSMTPAPYCKEMKDAAQFYLNRVLKDFKDKDKKHVDWVKLVNGLLSDLQVYVKEHHTTGVAWNMTGPVASAGGAGGPCPPPPGPPPPVVPPPPAVQTPSGPGGSASVTNALFGEINKAGTNIASGLRKVKRDEMTHKNPALRKTGPVPDKPKPGGSAPKPTAKPTAAKKLPVFELKGKKWIIEHQEDRRDIVFEGTMQQTVYVYKCTNVTVRVKGKINSIVVDNCKKTAIVFENALSTCEFVNCQRVQCQVNGKVPTVSIDKTDGCQVYLNKDALKVEIVTSKSSEMNIMVPKPDGEFAEFSLPEQFKTSWDGKDMVTQCLAAHG